MNTPFPFGFDGPMALYLTLYTLTLAVHVAFMSYVVAGTALLAALNLAGRAPTSPAAAILADWLTVALSVAITAGVAPLLFIQILYQKSFYTANLLLSHRWMLILPALIIGFYLLYLVKPHPAPTRPRWVGLAAIFGALICFLFTGASWTENHLLSQRPDLWASFYGSGAFTTFQVIQAPTIARLALWMTGTLPLAACLLGWQLTLLNRDNPGAFDPDAFKRDARTIALAAISGLAAAAASLAWLGAASPPGTLAPLTSPLATPYTAIAALGAALQILAWASTLRARNLSARALGLASIGAAMSLIGSVVGREAIRLAKADLQAVAAACEAAIDQGGSLLFVFFLVVNAALIGWCVRVSRKALRNPAPPHI